MRDYFRVLSLLRPHRGQLAALLVCIVIASALSSVSITFVSPLLRILFAEEPNPIEVVEEVSATEDVPDSSVPIPQGLREKQDEWTAQIESILYQGSREDMLWRLCVLLLLLFGAKNIFTFLQEVLRVRLEHQVIYDIRQSIYRSIGNLPLGFFSQERTGYLMSRVIIDVDMMRGAIVGVLTQLVSNGVMVLLAFTFAAMVSWKLLLTTFVVVPPNMLLVAWISRKLRRGSTLVQEEMGETAAVLQESIAGIRVIKSFDVHDRETGRFQRSNWSYFQAYVKLKVLEALSSPISEMLGIVTAVIIIAVGGRLVLEGQLRADLLFLFLGVMLWVIGPIKKLIKSNSTLQQSLAAATRVFEVLDAPKETDGDEGGRTDVTGVEREIHFDHVHFDYQPGRPVLRDIDLRVRAGEVIALVGPSGAGKSTLVDLLARFYEPSRGRILLDGVPLSEIRLKTLRNLIGIVSQEVILFHDTVANNISFGSVDIPREQIEDAARVANAHEFISELRHGYDTVVGERGLQLSGGQRQRLAIARAVLKNPPMLILDEATSALDTQSEREVQEAMARLMRGRTTFVIAHRLSTVRDADRILVLLDGEIVESGSHRELYQSGGKYRQLYDLQLHEGEE